MTRPLRRTLQCAFLFLATPLLAQTDPVEVADRATSARAWWRDAAEALRDGDSLLALTRLDSAVTAWPSQSAYHRGVARLALRLGRTDRALAALDALTTLGASWSAEDPAFMALAGDPRFAAATQRNREATAPMTRSRVVWEVRERPLHPEGVAVDSATGRYFISSGRPGRVLVRERDGRVHDFFPPGTRGAQAILGMAIDRRRGLLWVTSADTTAGGVEYPEFSGVSALYAFDLTGGAFRARVELPPANRGHQLGDVIITPSGTLYTSDTKAGVIFKVPAGPLPGGATIVAQGSPAFRSIQGMVVTPDERVMYLADYSHGLLRIDLATGEVTGLAAPSGGTLLGIDGMASGGPGRLIAIQNGIAPVRVIAIALDGSGTGVTGIEVLDRPDLGTGEATLGVRVGDSFVYVATQPGMLRSLSLTPR
jgi:sugar lactone lactonase YvrE